MNVQEAKQILANAGFSVVGETRLGNDTRTQLKLDGGTVFNVYDKGTYYVQGKDKKAIDLILAGSSPVGFNATSNNPHGNKKIFVVYGKDTTTRNILEMMLRRWGLEPLILEKLPSHGQTIIEKLESYTEEVNFGVVLATPDDEGYQIGHADEKAYRARQNVVLELGMLLSKLGRKRVAILLKQQDNMERPSDIQGLIYIPFKDDLEKDAGVILAKEMCAQGFDINIANL